nr:hypothetical protein B0A51_03166 [Rachicladosporium sp. CCFEE 5018]
MVANGVNKTALHPKGVVPQVEHTEIEEELHEKAHIDYERVAIIANPSVPALYEDALVYETGSAITSSGALSAYSGAKTGRSPSDKRIVEEDSSKDNVWWGPVNKPMSPEVWKINRERAVDYLNTRNRIYVIDGFAGWDERYRINVRVVCARAYHALFMRNMLIRPSRKELEHFHPDYVIYNAGAFPANRWTTGMTSATSVSINFAEKEMVILGTEYAEDTTSDIDAVQTEFDRVKMSATTTAILAILLQLVFTSINGPGWVNPRFHLVFPSLNRLSELAGLLGITFCPGLHGILQAAAPPPMQWFLSLSATIPNNTWAVYALILRKPGHRDKLYIGSCTSAKRGVVARFYEYDAGKHVPRCVQKASDDGYTIKQKVLLAHCPIPPVVKLPLYSVVIIALEAAFACVFWAMFKREHDYGFNGLCPWPMTSFKYDGLCTHSPFKEAIDGGLELSEEQLKETTDATNAKAIDYGRDYHKRQRDEATPEFKAAQARANKKMRPKTQLNRAAAKAAKLFYCAPCDYAADNNGHLTEHKNRKSHRTRVREYEGQQRLTFAPLVDQDQQEGTDSTR